MSRLPTRRNIASAHILRLSHLGKHAMLQVTAWTIISKLMEEKPKALQQNQRLHQELDLLKSE
ncbi:hypothetical protein SAY87_022305 [Trapa incisa]|uniref:Uncharacterized protein n=1 Tax=Trapa incisa TaxID=236973 RepID=A0AAN7K400_9MYRT|nr:hypothetical protein SAY87_022305 [Trapa incisa]